MKLSRAIEMHKASGLDSLIVISIPLTSGLTDFSLDFFPPFFRGWCSSSIHQIPETLGIQEVELDEYFEGIDADVFFSRASFMVENCRLETVEQFAREYETRTNCKPGDANELMVLNISLKTDATSSRQDINTSVRPATPEPSLQHQTNAQASIFPTPSKPKVAGQ